MRIYSDSKSLKKDLDQVISQTKSSFEITNEKKLRQQLIDRLIYTAVFAKNSQLKEKSYKQIRRIALAYGAYPASIHKLYMKLGKMGKTPFTVPAINLRMITYDVARIIFKIALEKKMGVFIFEIARSEVGYTNQKPKEYASAILAAAIKEGYRGPIFIQGDHYQFKAKIFNKSREEEINNIKKIIKESVEAGFYNIDIDASTLVNLSKKNLDGQQKNNYEMTALMTKYIRKIEPKKITVSVGGEIGHIGGRNSTVGDLEAFMEGFLRKTKKGKIASISKVSVQTGTSHGGIPLLDGTIAKVKLDFKVLKDTAKLAHKKYKIGGPVQHGASTLPEELFNQFPKNDTLEIHLATGFQNIVYDCLPKKLTDKMYHYLKNNHKKEWKGDWSETQFIYKLRKKAFAPYKTELWYLPENVKNLIRKRLRKKFLTLFEKLNCFNNKKYIVKDY